MDEAGAGLGLMWPVYTITGYDASAHTAEETVQAARNVPRGILRSVYLSGLFGWVMVCSFVLAMPNLSEAVHHGENVFAWLMTRVLPGNLGTLLWIGIVVANYLCGLACITSTSRMTFAFARDGGLPFSGELRKISQRWRTPVIAIWTVASLLIVSMLYTPAYSTLTTAGVIFFTSPMSCRPLQAFLFAVKLGQRWGLTGCLMSYFRHYRRFQSWECLA